MNNNINANSRLNSMRLYHRRIDSRIARETKRPLPDHLLIGELKRRKLMLKDKIFFLKHAKAATTTAPPQ